MFCASIFWNVSAAALCRPSLLCAVPRFRYVVAESGKVSMAFRNISIASSAATLQQFCRSLPINNADVAAAIRFGSCFRFEFPIDLELPIAFFVRAHSHERCRQDVVCLSVSGVDAQDLCRGRGCFRESTHSQVGVGDTKISSGAFRVRRKRAIVFVQCIVRLYRAADKHRPSPDARRRCPA